MRLNPKNGSTLSSFSWVCSTNTNQYCGGSIYLPPIMAPLLLALSLQFCGWQKPAIDTHAIAQWPSLAIQPTISVHGHYLAYTVTTPSPASPQLILRASHGTWKKEFIGVTHCYFSDDETLAVLSKRDSLLFLRLGTDSERILRCQTFQWPADGKGQRLAWQQPEGALTVLNFRTGKTANLGIVTQYGFDETGHHLVLADTSGLSVIDLETGNRIRFYTWQPGDEMQGFQWDKVGRQLIFLIHGTASTIGYYKIGGPPARILIQEANVGTMQLSRDGRWIFFTKTRKNPGPPNADSGDTGPVIWNGQDVYLRPDAGVQPVANWAYIIMGDTTVKRLETASRRLLGAPALVTGDWVLVSDSDAYQLISLKTGAMLRIGSKAHYPANWCFSPGGKWFVYYDIPGRQYVSCELATGKLHVISNRLPNGVASEFPRGVRAQAVAEPAGWLSGDSAMLLYDNYDCWAVDPAGRRRPTNLTGGYGSRNHIKLRLIDQTDASGTPPVFSPGDTLLLTGFNVINKFNGLYRLNLGLKPRLDSLFMGPYTFFRVESQKPHHFAFDDGMKPVKATAANVWIVKRESAVEAPNYFLTTDFRHFDPMSSLAPQTGYSWLTTELVEYTMPDGATSQGILYKPEDFNPARKYPVLFNIYEQYSHRLYEFPPPELSHDNFNIPWFVSRGYLVFTPDIRYHAGKTIGYSAARSVVAAAHYLRRLPFVDAKRLGIQGHSLGAEETDDILIHSGIFAAAAEMAGPSDPTSAYLSLFPWGTNAAETRENQQIWEIGQGRMGATPWQHPERYLLESAVLQANKIITPLLIIHNPQDAAVPYRQGIELFLALRRLKKPVWMLQYPGQGHSIIQNEAAFDYTSRLTDFFGYFLQQQPLPAWMRAGN